MNRTLVLKRLGWKEFQQLWPLAALLLALGALLQALFLLASDQRSAAQAAEIVILGLPGLFAVGVGALLVGQEKELRTLSWLNSMPVAARDIITSKWLVGLLGLAVVWLVCGLLSLLWGTFFGQRLEWASFSAWFVHSFFLLSAGYATAWRLRSSFFSLLLLMPIATLPLLATTIQATATGSTVRVDQDGNLIIYTIAFALVFALYSYRAGLRCLSPSSPAPLRSQVGTLSPTSRSSLLVAVRPAATPALIWQYVAQNRLVLAGLSLFFVVAAVAGYWTTALDQAAGAIVIVTVFFACSWLGLLVFQSDAVDRRYLFLADRGLKPGQLWMTRLLIPAAILSAGLLLVLLSASIELTKLHLAVSFALAVFLSSTWTGQLVRSQIVGACLAPVVSAVVLVLSSLAIGVLITPWWLIASSGLVLLLATRWQMRRWVDGRLGVSYWLTHAGFLAGALVLPVIPFLMFVASFPRLPADVKQELTRTAALYNVNEGRLGELMTHTPDAVRATEADELSIPAARAQRLETLRQQLAEQPFSVPQYQTLQQLTTDLLLVRAHLELQPSDDERLAAYRNISDVLVLITQRLRISPRLLDQDMADQCEVALLEEVRLPGARERLGEPLFSIAVKRLRDQPGRREARRRAIAVSWKRYANNDLGGYSILDNLPRELSARDMFTLSRKAELVSGYLLQLLDASPPQQAELRLQIGQLMGRSADSGSRVFHVEDDSGTPQLLVGELFETLSPAALWRGEWENLAAQLAVPTEAAADAERGDSNPLETVEALPAANAAEDSPE